MSTITAEKIQHLRRHTGMGLLDCKRALVQVDGDLNRAEEFLKRKYNGSGCLCTRSTPKVTEGRVVSVIVGHVGVLVEVNCETNFVARTVEFRAFCEGVAVHIAATTPSSVEELLAQKLDGQTVEQLRVRTVAVLGEQILIRRFERFELGGESVPST